MAATAVFFIEHGRNHTITGDSGIGSKHFPLWQCRDDSTRGGTRAESCAKVKKYHLPCCDGRRPLRPVSWRTHPPPPTHLALTAPPLSTTKPASGQREVCLEVSSCLQKKNPQKTPLPSFQPECDLKYSPRFGTPFSNFNVCYVFNAVYIFPVGVHRPRKPAALSLSSLSPFTVLRPLSTCT